MDVLEHKETPTEPTGQDMPPAVKQDEEVAGPMDCCKRTIDMHGENNPMMVCSECKQIIKCFEEEKAFRNYRRFCQSRHRRILSTRYSNWWVVVFRSYDTYST